jgi:hypothetical protein
MKFKEGVHIPGLKIQMRLAMSIADKIWNNLGQELVITSALDGVHSAGSLHYYGFALDLRSRYFTPDQKKQAVLLLAKALGPDYEIIAHASHIHIEYDPK